uniref:RAB17, member RAS oncogene family n=1 Tax=Sus scrofa TaxID=9823 RepID=A0A8D1M9D0_PIG
GREVGRRPEGIGEASVTIHVPTASLDTRKAVWDPWWCETPSTLHTEDSELGPCEFISLPKASVESAKLNSQFLVTLGFFWKVPSSTRGVCSVPRPRLAALGLTQAQAEQRVKTGAGHELPFQVPSSVPGAFFTKVVDLGAASLKLEIWDTAGQEKYHSVCHLYFRGANAALVVYDVTRKDSFLKAQQWLKDLEEEFRLGDVVVMLVGNKLDLGKEREVAFEVGLEPFWGPRWGRTNTHAHSPLPPPPCVPL